MTQRDRGWLERQRKLVHRTLVDGLKAAGIAPNTAAVLEELAKLGANDASLERSVARDLDGQVGTANRRDTRERWALYEQAIREKSASHADELGDQCRKLRGGDAGDGEVVETWYSVIPRQDGRTYASIDRVSVDHSEGEVITGSIQRLSPGDQRDLHWEFHGTRDAEAIFVAFWPLERRNARSRGTIALTRPRYESGRGSHDFYEGHYTRLLDDERGLLTRAYGWYKEVPASAFPRVALLDLDNTLVADWTIRPWLRSLSRRPDWRKAAAACAEEVEQFVEDFRRGALDHDQLVNSCEQSYANLMAGRSVAAVDDAAAVFFESRKNRRREHDFVRPLVDYLMERGVAPIIVSGAPAELVSRYARSLGLAECHGLSLSIEGDTYTGRVKCNPGTTAEKERIVSLSSREERDVVLALGDSASDEPLWEAAPRKVIVGHGYSLDDVDQEDVFTIDPSAKVWPEFREWLDMFVEPDEEFT